jgi:hypothetical protein
MVSASGKPQGGGTALLMPQIFPFSAFSLPDSKTRVLPRSAPFFNTIDIKYSARIKRKVLIGLGFEACQCFFLPNYLFSALSG